MLVIARAALPGFARVTDCPPLVVPTSWPAKVRLLGERLAPGPVTPPALVKTQLSLRLPSALPPAKTTIRPETVSSTSAGSALTDGGPPVGLSCVHVAVPP